MGPRDGSGGLLTMRLSGWAGALLAVAAVAAIVTGSAFGPSAAITLGHADSGTVSPIATLTDSGSKNVNLVAFSPDGKTLATGGPGGTALWDVSYLTDPLARLCAQAGGSLTPADWSRYVQAGTPYQNACH